jgi:DNA-binding NarL/FixJ family response regulator
MKPHVVLADDHAMMVEGLRSLLHGHVEIVGSAADGRTLVETAAKLKPDIVILDISMPEMNGLEAARLLRKTAPESRLIFLTMYTDPLYLSEALRLGVSAYVLKQSASSELLTAIETVQQGQVYITPALRHAGAGTPRLKGDLLAGADLTARQREVLQLVAEGRSAKEIAAHLGVSVKTAQFHKSNLMQRLGLHSTAELVKYAVRHGMTPS